MKLHELSAVELSEKIKNSDITSEEVTKIFLDRIESIDEKTGAFVSVNREKALKEAKEYAQKEMGVKFINVDVQAFRNKVLGVQKQMLKDNTNIRDSYKHFQTFNKKYEKEAK